MRNLKNKKGFTLIEVIVTVMILSVVFAMLATIVSFFSKFNRDENSALNNQESMRLLVIQVEKDIRMSDQTFNPDTGLNCDTIGTDNVDAKKTEYCFDETTQVVTRDGNVIAEEIFNFQLEELGSAINVDIESIEDTRGNMVDISTTIYLRNGETIGE
jgi:prepilin-type N-terminal cleavage/methylation domain-containing protein